MDNRGFYDLRIIRSYNRIMNIVIGARGCGKTYSFKDWAFDDFIKTGAQFVYMRRYDVEFDDKSFKDGFVPNELRLKYAGHEIKVDGRTCYIDGLVAGSLIALSTAGQKKGTEMQAVNKVLFDEFIIDKKKYTYLPDETTLFFEFVETVQRERRVLFFLMANNVSFNNPYCVKWNIRHPKDGSEFYKTPYLILHEPRMEEYVKRKLSSDMGKFMQEVDPSYVEYAYLNKSLRDNIDFIQHKNGQCKYFFTMYAGGKPWGVWIDRTQGCLYVSPHIDNTSPFIFTFLTDDMKPNVLLMKGNRTNKFVKAFFECWKNGVLYYETNACKMAVDDILKKTY